MNKRNLRLLLILFLLSSTMLNAQKSKAYQLNSPDSAIVLKITVGTKLQWSVEHRGQVIIAPSAISLLLNDGEVLGNDAKIVTVKTEKNKYLFLFN